MPSPLSDEQLRDLSVAVTLAPRLDRVLDPADARVVRMVGQRFLHFGRACGMALHEWAAVRRAAGQLEAAERVAADAMAARRRAAAEAARPTFISRAAEGAAGLLADVRQGALTRAGLAG